MQVTTGTQELEPTLDAVEDEVVSVEEAAENPPMRRMMRISHQSTCIQKSVDTCSSSESTTEFDKKDFPELVSELVDDDYGRLGKMSSPGVVDVSVALGQGLGSSVPSSPLGNPGTKYFIERSKVNNTKLTVRALSFTKVSHNEMFTDGDNVKGNLEKHAIEPVEVVHGCVHKNMLIQEASVTLCPTS